MFALKSYSSPNRRLPWSRSITLFLAGHTRHGHAGGDIGQVAQALEVDGVVGQLVGVERPVGTPAVDG